jgi:hypothetical protein
MAAPRIILALVLVLVGTSTRTRVLVPDSIKDILDFRFPEYKIGYSIYGVSSTS